MDDWAQQVVEQAAERSQAAAREREEQGARTLALQETAPADAVEVERRNAVAEEERADRIAARVQAAAQLQQQNHRPYSDYDQRMLAQALGGQPWHDGPTAA